MRVESRPAMSLRDLRAVGLGDILLPLCACSPVRTAIGFESTLACTSAHESGLVEASEDDVIWLDIDRRLMADSMTLAQPVRP
jgi:hypothetical protein